MTYHIAGDADIPKQLLEVSFIEVQPTVIIYITI